jgi:hypothetical protein
MSLTRRRVVPCTCPAMMGVESEAGVVLALSCHDLEEVDACLLTPRLQV